MEKKIKQLLKTIKLNESMLSMILGVLTVVLIGVLAIRMYRSNTPNISEPAEMTQSSPTPTQKIGQVAITTMEDGKQYPMSLPENYTVVKGDHLWKIAEKLYGSGYNWVDIAKENLLVNASQIEVGQVLTLPKVAVRLTTIQQKQLTKALSKTEVTIVGDSYTVVKGDNLWNIAVRAYADGYKWPEIAKANEINNANVIEVGQKLSLPR